MTKIKILLCALALTGCSAAVQPTWDAGPEPAADGSSSDPDTGADLGTDAGDPDADLGTDAGDPDLGPAPDAGPAPCVSNTDPPVVEVCGDGTCCTRPCEGRTCHAPVSGGFCLSCFYFTCPSGETECLAVGGMVCPCR